MVGRKTLIRRVSSSTPEGNENVSPITSGSPPPAFTAQPQDRTASAAALNHAFMHPPAFIDGGSMIAPQDAVNQPAGSRWLRRAARSAHPWHNAAGNRHGLHRR